RTCSRSTVGAWHAARLRGPRSKRPRKRPRFGSLNRTLSEESFQRDHAPSLVPRAPPGRAEADGHSVAHAVLRAPLGACLSRVQNRLPDRLSDAAVVQRLWDDFADLGPPEAHVIDTGTATAERTARVLTERPQGTLLLV